MVMASETNEKQVLHVYAIDCTNSKCKNGRVPFEKKVKGGYELQSIQCSTCKGTGSEYRVFEENDYKGTYSAEDLAYLRKEYTLKFPLT